MCGPLTTIRTDDDDVFLNLGRGYPDPARFTIIIWDVGEVERLPAGTELCATGIVSSYYGVAQIELSDIGAVEVWERHSRRKSLEVAGHNGQVVGYLRAIARPTRTRHGSSKHWA